MGVCSKKKALASRGALIVLTLLAQPVKSVAERLPIRTYTTADGLPRDHINRIVQDSKGFLWFCTSEGLSRFDGYTFTNYGTDQGLADREVTDFLETRTGAYWAATDKGLCRFFPDALQQAGGGSPGSSERRFLAYYPGDDPEARSIDGIYEDHAGTIWCATQAGLYRVDLSSGQPAFSFVDIIQPAREPDTKLRIEAVAEDRGGSLWIIAQSGLHRLRPDGAVERYTAEEGLPEGASSAVLEDRDGRIWVASGVGLLELVADPRPHRSVVARQYTVQDGLASNAVLCLSQSSDGTLWIGTNRGLSAFRPNRGKPDGGFQTYTEANGLARSAIATLCEDRDHNMWAGTDSGGAMRLAATGFVSYDEGDGLGAGGRVGSIIKDREGELCVIAHNTISRYSGGKLIPTPIKLPAGSNMSWGWYQIMFQDSAGEWWLNTDRGLVRYPRPTGVEQLAHARPKAIYRERDGLPTDGVFRLFEDSRRDIWISTLGNSKAVLARWDRATETFHTYHPSDGIPEAAPTAFCEDSAGNLWIGFYTGGLIRYRDGRFMPFASSNGVPPGMVRGLYLDRAQRLWIATAEGGVARIDQPAVEHPSVVSYSAADGLSSNQATCVTEDDRGMIYIGTGRGLDQLDPATGYIRHYTTADGLANSFVNVSFRDTDGSLWFGTLQGLSRLVPQPEQSSPPAPVLITAIHVSGTLYPIPELGAQEVILPDLGPSQNHVQIDFLSLNLVLGETLRYQYKLEGAGDWAPSTGQRTVDYPALPPGTYRFLVRAVTPNGSPGDRVATVAFKILPTVWQRWWFRLAAAILILVPVLIVARYRRQRTRAVREADEILRKSREERLAELERVRTRIATDLHDDIGSSLTQITVLGEVARQKAQLGDRESGIDPLERIIAVSNELADTMSDIVWAINPKRDHLSDLVHRMRRFASDVFTCRGISLRFDSPPEASDIELGANLRREVFLIFKESINNIVKHSGCTEAEVKLRVEGDWLTLEVSDNGSGFEWIGQGDTGPLASPSARGGNGIPGMRKRVREMGGEFEIDSGNDKGTTARLRVSIAQEQAEK